MLGLKILVGDVFMMYMTWLFWRYMLFIRCDVFEKFLACMF